MPKHNYMRSGASRGSTSTGSDRRADIERARERYAEALEEINADSDLIESARDTKSKAS
jgi:hypothetical protein